MPETKRPEKALALAHAAIDAGWSVAINHSVDTGNSPFVTVEASRPGKASTENIGHMEGAAYFRVTWHTRGTGTYRLFDCQLGEFRYKLHAATLTAVTAKIEGSDS